MIQLSELYMQLWTQLGPGKMSHLNMVYIHVVLQVILTIHAAVSVHIGLGSSPENVYMMM